VIVVAFLAQITGVLGGFTCPLLQRVLGWSNLRCLITLVSLMALLPVYGILGLVSPYGGLRTPAEMYVVASLFGLVFGPFQSFGESATLSGATGLLIEVLIHLFLLLWTPARTVFSELIPPGRVRPGVSFVYHSLHADRSAIFMLSRKLASSLSIPSRTSRRPFSA
jgi:hypothetical protein